MLNLRWIFFFVFFGLIQWYAYQAIKTIGFNKWMLSIYSLTIAIIFGNFIYHSLFYTRATGFTPNFSIAIGIFLALFIFQFILVCFGFEDLIRIPQGIYRYFIEKERVITFQAEENSSLNWPLDLLQFHLLLYCWG